MTDPARYLLAQLPGWILAALVIALTVSLLDVSSWWWLILPAVILKDVLLFPAMRRAFGPPRTGLPALIGASAVVTERVAPTGQVRGWEGPQGVNARA
jgi:membrane protein implicated in regulation of membrane protease activity